MLNISPNRIIGNLKRTDYPALNEVEERTSGRVLIRLIGGLFILFVIIMFIPWTQNIRARGQVTTLQPDHRPQTIHSIIAGRIEKWYVNEGDFVERGDTILHISEVKNDYLDPDLLSRTEKQLKAKEMSMKSYDEKVKALNGQIQALEETSELKLQQAKNKLQQARLSVSSDSIDYEAAELNFKIAKQQYERMEKLHADGLKSLTDLENRRMTMQKAQAQMIAAENRLLASRNEVLNAKVELTSIRAQYRDQIAKAQSEKFTALSNMYDTEATVTKLQNQYTNYSVRTGMYYITAPQNGYITQAIKTGIGETVKEGESIVSIMPADYELAVEMYVKPMDLPLLDKGQDVRIQFDGWPAIVFSGWPNTSYGTYGGEVFAMDNFISQQNGRYRILIKQDPEDVEWPDPLRIGAGATSMVLLKDVPIWYELWRQINGFPPDYYKGGNTGNQNKKSMQS